MAESGPRQEDIDYQRTVLPQVSRSFALTIPQLPERLEITVGNAYLLCRIADAIEDDPGLSQELKRSLHDALIASLRGDMDVADFAQRAAGELTEATIPEERALVANTAQVMRLFSSFDASDRRAVATCVEKMARGMPDFQHEGKRRGLESMAQLDAYCYFVAGVVGEMLTDLFCNADAETAKRRAEMMNLSASFGQGLQMVNILKDVWEDLEAGTCWLPNDVFERVGIDLAQMTADRNVSAYGKALEELLGVAHGHLRNALEYTLLIPAQQKGVRLFCVWSVGLALLTLAKLQATPGYRSADEVKVSRTTVGAVIACTRLAVRSDTALRALFRFAARSLPVRNIRQLRALSSTGVENSESGAVHDAKIEAPAEVRS